MRKWARGELLVERAQMATPTGRGGREAIGNLLPACGSCNSSKKNRFVMEWKVAR